MYTNGVMFERTTMNKVYKEECDCETRQKSGIFLDSIRPRKGHQKLSTAFQNLRNPILRVIIFMTSQNSTKTENPKYSKMECLDVRHCNKTLKL